MQRAARLLTDIHALRQALVTTPFFHLFRLFRLFHLFRLFYPFSSKESLMRIPFGLIIVVAGIVLFVMGVVASESVSSSVSKFFTGEPSDRSIWLMLGGIGAIIAGGAIGWRGSRV